MGASPCAYDSGDGACPLKHKTETVSWVLRSSKKCASVNVLDRMDLEARERVDARKRTNTNQKAQNG